MIQINLLPPEYRPRTGTPMARFVAIVAGIVLVLSAGGVYAYTHFIELSKVRELKRSRTEEVRSMEMQRERSVRLQAEIDSYEQRRTAIQTINRSRTLWSRKLDQFFEILTSRDADETSALWLEELNVPVKIVSMRRRRPPSKSKASAPVEPAAQFKFEGYMAMANNSEAPALLSAFHKALTGDPETTGTATDFYADFMSINNPNIEMLRNRRGQEKLLPPRVGVFSYELGLRPPALDGKGKKNTK